MATQTLERALQRLRRKAESDDRFAEVVEFLAGEDVADPWAPPPRPVLAAARSLTRTRQDADRAEFASRALDTGEVVALIGSISDRKAVDRRRKREALLGVRAGRRMLHPDWQFDRRRGDTRDGLTPVLDALRQVTVDPLAADAVMTTPQVDLGGRNIAAVFADGDIGLAVRLIRMAGDQS